MGHDEGSSDTKKTPLHDTVPGVPDMELGRTLPTGAAYAGAPPPAAATQRSGAADPAAPRSTLPPAGTGGPLTFGTTQRDFGGGSAGQKLSAREKAKRNVLTHTLQMPLVVAPVPPTSTPVSDARRMTIKGSGVAPAAPAGWTSMHRVGSGAPPEPTSSRAAQRSTVPLQNPNFEREPSQPQSERRADASERFRRAEPSEPFKAVGASESNASTREPEPSHERAERTGTPNSPYAWQYPPPAGDRERNRWRVEYERDTLPGATSVRVPSLSTKEWLFIGLLTVASAATLYSLLIDDATSPLEEDVGAATGVAPEHVVTPAPLPDPTSGRNVPGSPGASQTAAAGRNLTEIVSEPAHAEIVLGGAVIGNTPASVVRGEKDADYLLRKPGYEPQLVRVSPHSPRSITITLHAKQF